MRMSIGSDSIFRAWTSASARTTFAGILLCLSMVSKSEEAFETTPGQEATEEVPSEQPL
jgi:hypothetical protein